MRPTLGIILDLKDNIIFDKTKGTYIFLLVSVCPPTSVPVHGIGLKQSFVERANPKKHLKQNLKTQFLTNQKKLKGLK